ncbi:uncharacterized protein LOC121370949 [Gigantopelta aegis]|uniref:uncharacterized protein LOC121370949 n=1 Tax=Gigantopelta aegis TaxID=1735272 RepID=UPI001B88C4B6|nr:uncharacterized protein LOC121370949 [Gigantopelta aegis]
MEKPIKIENLVISDVRSYIEDESLLEAFPTVSIKIENAPISLSSQCFTDERDISIHMSQEAVQTNADKDPLHVCESKILPQPEETNSSNEATFQSEVSEDFKNVLPENINAPTDTPARESRQRETRISIEMPRSTEEGSKESDSDFDSSDNEPLAALGNHSNPSESSCHLSSGEEYLPSEEESNSLSSESDSGPKSALPKVKLKKKQVRARPQSKPKLNKNGQQKLSAAMGERRQVQNYVQIMHEMHTKRLLQLVECNGYQMRAVPADGNSFFEACSISMSAAVNSTELRKLLCDYLEENMIEYVDFLLVPENAELEKDYRLEVKKLRQDGYFSNSVAEFLPLAIANWSGQCVRILCSKATTPLIDVKPTLRPPVVDTPIVLAHTSIRGLPDHYDACKPLKSSTTHTHHIQGATVLTEKNRTELTPNSIDAKEDVNSNTTSSSTALSDSVRQDVSFTNGTTVTADVPSASVDVSATTPVKPSKRPSITSSKKSAAYNTSPKKKLPQKRTAAPETWLKNKRKRLKLSGAEYVNQEGKTMRAKSVQKVDCTKCRYRCSEHFSEEIRQRICQAFWKLCSYKKQKDFICSNTEETKTRTYLDEEKKAINKTRQVHRTYSFEHEGERHKVCKTFFRQTLDLGEAYINHAMKYSNKGVFYGSEKRGKHKPHNKTTSDQLSKVRKHIGSFTRLDAHNTRRNTKKPFSGHLNTKEMYNLYEKKCKSDGIKPVSVSLYRKIFKDEFEHLIPRSIPTSVPSLPRIQLRKRSRNAR